VLTDFNDPILPSLLAPPLLGYDPGYAWPLTVAVETLPITDGDNASVREAASLEDLLKMASRNGLALDRMALRSRRSTDATTTRC
jgi:hypothetical protein